VLNLSWVASWLQHLDPGPAAALTFSHLQHQHKHQYQHQRCLKPAHHRPPTKTFFFHPFSSWCLLAARHSNTQKRHSPHIRSETQLPLPCLFYGIIVSRHSNKVFPAFEAIFILPCTSPNLISHPVSTVRSTVKKTLRLANMTLNSLPVT